MEGPAGWGEPDVLRRGRVLEANLRPTPDQIYLIHCINEKSESEYHLGPGNIYGWNRRYGVGVVTSVLRTLHGFPPQTTIKNSFKYVSAVLAATEGEPG